MNYYISNGTFYAVPQRSNELMHYGVPGMKWGRRKARPTATGGVRRASSVPTADQAAQREARKAKAKKALKIGAAVAGTALAAYGTYKLAKYVQGKRNAAAFQKAQDYVDKNVYQKFDHRTFRDGTHQMGFRNEAGDVLYTARGARNSLGKQAGRHNAQVVAKGRQMYKDATNTRLDRGLAKVVNTGDAVSNATKTAAKNASNATKTAAKNAANATKTAARNAANAAKNSKAGQAVRTTKNKVLDAVNPIYEYTPHTTSKTWEEVLPNGGRATHTQEITNYIKRQKKRT